MLRGNFHVVPGGHMLSWRNAAARVERISKFLSDANVFILAFADASKVSVFT